MNPEISRVVVASTSSRRQDFSRHAFAGKSLDFHPGGEEAETSPVITVMNGKLDHVAGKISNSDETVLILAADTKTAILVQCGDKLLLKSHGKPKNEESVRLIFMQMAEAAQNTLASPVYVVESASGSLVTNTNDRKESHGFCIVELNQEKVSFFATPEGFSIYRETFELFYKGPAYNAHEPIHLTDVSAGLSLPVLVKLGAVKSVDQVSPDDPSFIDKFKKALFHVAVGLDPQVWGDDHAVAHGWPWLDEVAGQCF